MRTGILDGEINGLWQVAHDSGELASAVTSYDITGLEGDTDIEYKLIHRVIGAVSVAGIYMQYNDDTGTNYGTQYVYGSSTTAGALRTTGDTAMIIGRYSLAEHSFGTTHIFSKSGKERTSIAQFAGNVTGTTVGYIWKPASVWSNTADEMTSIKVFSAVTNGFGIGSRFILLKKVHNDAMKTGVITPNKIEGAWERIYSNTLTSAATSVAISSLTGNTDILYRMVIRAKNDYAGLVYLPIKINGDNGSNYGRQSLYGTSTTVAATRGAGTGAYLSPFQYAQNALTLSDILIYAKSGYERTALVTTTGSVLTTTVQEVSINGYSWNNTADEITYLTLAADQTNGLGVGTSIELYKLNL